MERKGREGAKPDAAFLQVREQIALLDQQLKSLLAQRFACSKQMGEYKAKTGLAVYDQHREMQILRSIRETVEPELAPHLEAVWQAVFLQSRQIQYGKMIETGAMDRFVRMVQTAPSTLPALQRVAFVGSSGTLVEQLLKTVHPDALALPCPSFRAAFHKLLEEEVEYLFLPLEDSVIGSFREVYYLLAETDSFILQAVEKRLPYQLLVRPGVSLSEIHTVVAHPKVLLDCAKLIQNLGWNRLEEESSPAAARLTAQHVEGSIAAIATEYEARAYGLEVLPTALPAQQGQTVRYILVGRALTKLPKSSRAVVSCVLSNQPRSLAYLTSVLGDAGVNIRKLRTHEVEGEPWNQMIQIELDAHEGQEPILLEALNMLQVETGRFRLLGLFPQVQLD